MKRLTALVLIGMLGCGLGGCYNTYVVPTIELRRLQSPEALMNDQVLQDKIDVEEVKKLVNRAAKDPVAVTTEAGPKVAVMPETKIFVRSMGGRRYRVTPFNFRIAGSQLVASDRDTLMPLASIKTNEIDLLSTGKTAGIIAVGVGAVAGVIAAIVSSSGQKSFSDND